MTANLQNPIFTDETKAREWLETRVWPQGPVCPHCGSTGDDVTKLEGKKHVRASTSATVPRAVHGHGQDGIRTLKNADIEVARRAIPSDGFKERRQRAPSSSLAWHLI